MTIGKTSQSYATIFDEYYIKGMQNKIEETSDFNTNIPNEPISLLKATKKLMHNPFRSKYTYRLTKYLSEILNIEQGDKYNFTKYVKSFKGQR